MDRFNQNIPKIPLMFTSRSPYFYHCIFIGLLLIRLFFNGVLPLMDQTEARYAEIARLMVETANWVVLQIDYGIPFWAKPPLSTWAAAACMYLLGANEFVVRLPYFFICLGIALWMGRYNKNHKTSFLLPGCILLTIPEFYLHAGVVSTDVFLLLSIVLVMLSFWESMQKDAAAYWGYLFFVGMGMGMLAKGPIVGVLTLPPILFWAWQSRQLSKAFRTAPWFLGVIIFLGVALPWYFLTEARSPGFVDYFVVGEHFNRYFNAAWKGDKYGFPKQQPLGIIWGFFIAFCLPWSIIALRWIIKQWQQIKNDSWVIFLLAWMLWPLVFFSTSKSLIHPYTLPSVVPLALLLTKAWPQISTAKQYLKLGVTIPTLLLIIYFTGITDAIFNDNSDKSLLANIANEKCFSYAHKSYSSQFYTNGSIQKIEPNDMDIWQDQHPNAYLLIRHKDTLSLFQKMKGDFLSIDSNKKKGLYRYKRE